MKRTTTIVVQEELEVSRFEDDNMTSSPDDKIHDRGNLSQDENSSSSHSESDQIRSIEDVSPTDKTHENLEPKNNTSSVDLESLPCKLQEPEMEEIINPAPDSTRDSSTNSQEQNTKGRQAICRISDMLVY